MDSTHLWKYFCKLVGRLIGFLFDYALFQILPLAFTALIWKIEKFNMIFEQACGRKFSGEQ